MVRFRVLDVVLGVSDLILVFSKLQCFMEYVRRSTGVEIKGLFEVGREVGSYLINVMY